MKIVFLLFSFFAFHIQSESIKYYRPSSDYPIELQSLLFYIDINSLDSKRKKDIEKRLQIIEIAASFLKKDELFFLIKSSIYKSVLANAPKKFSKIFPTKEEREKALEHFKENKGATLTLWPMTGIISDLEKLEKESTKFNYYNKKAKGNPPKNFPVYQRKIYLTLKWFYFFKDQPKETIYNSLGKITELILTSLGNELHFYIHKTKMHFKNDLMSSLSNKLISFQVIDPNKKQKLKNRPKKPSIEAIIEPIISQERTHTGSLPKVNKNRSESKNSKNLSKIKNVITVPTKEPLSPKDLPTATNDWIPSRKKRGPSNF